MKASRKYAYLQRDAQPVLRYAVRRECLISTDQAYNAVQLAFGYSKRVYRGEAFRNNVRWALKKLRVKGEIRNPTKGDGTPIRGYYMTVWS